MNKQFILICLICEMLFSVSLKSQINSSFSSSAEIATSGNNIWVKTGASGLSVDAVNGWAVLTNYNGTSYTNIDCRMSFTFSPTIKFGGLNSDSYKYILAKEQNISTTNDLVMKLRFINSGPTNNDYLLYAVQSGKTTISRYVIPGTNSVLCMSRVKDMYYGSSYLNTEKLITNIQYMHYQTSGSVLNTFNIDFIKSYLDSTAVFGSSEMDAAKFDVDFNSSTYTTGFSASPTTLTTDADNFILQSSASGTTDQAILTYEPAAPFLWTFSKQNVLVYKVNKNSLTTNSHLKLRFSVPSTISPYTTTVFEYATPQYTSSDFDPNFKQVNIPGTNDFFLIFNLDGLTCGTSGAPAISALKTQNACTATKLQLLLYGGLQASEVVKVDYVKPFATMNDAFTYVNGVVSGTPTIKSATATTALTTNYGTASGSQTFYVSGCNLSADLVATAPTGFELNKDNGATWASSVTFAQTSGIAGGTLKIRLKADAAVTGSYNSQNIVLSSTGATSVNITTSASGNSVATKALTAIASPLASNKIYDGNATTTITGTFAGIVSPDDVYLTGTFADASAGNGKTVTVSATLGGAQASNYTFTGTVPTGLLANITPASQSITFSALPTGKLTGDVDFAPGATSATSGINPITYTTSNAAIASIVSNQIHSVGAGTCTIYADQASSTNYNAATQVSQSLTIAARPVIIVGSVATAADLTNPVADISVPANSELTIGATSTAHNITIERGGKVTLNNNVTLNVNNININSDASGTGTFVDKSTTGLAVTGTVKQYVTAGRNWYISIPLGSAASSVLNRGTSVVCYDESSASWIAPASGTLSAGRGYISVATSTPLVTGTTGTVDFTGALNTGVVSVGLTRHTGVAKEGFNLVGNPYPCYLDFSKVDTTAANILSTIWYRTKTALDAAYTFDTYNGLADLSTSNGATMVSKFIPPMQAFWVRVKAGQTSGTLTFTNAMRAHTDNSGNCLKAPSANKSIQQVVCLQVSNGINSDETIVLFNPNASNGYDAYDSPKMTNGNAAIPEVFTVVGTEQLVINGMSELKYDTEIPLGFTTGQENNFSITRTAMTNFDAGTRLMLKDKLLKTESELGDGISYNFSSVVTTPTINRFSLIFRAPASTTGLNSNSEMQNIQVFVNENNHITIIAPDKSKVFIYNIIGQKQFEANLVNSRTEISKTFGSGVYVIQLIINGQSQTRQVIIR